ncbi:MAG: gamma-glutamyl-gamma-aminobutyrate hydrolase family protein [Planctomycetes bacterium]|nr:gamma-glutamyl-gamma-aminobutyrate hydrolase family protein [Planctomycetota bacterium]
MPLVKYAGVLPRIGVNCNVKSGLRSQGDGRLLTLAPDFARALSAAGGQALLVPPLVQDGAADEAAIETVLDSVEGLVFSGGADMHPRAYGQEPHARTVLVDAERDASDLALARAALLRELPVLAICGGMQLVNVARGGTLHQHLPDLRRTKYPGLSAPHLERDAGTARHPVLLLPGTRLARLIGAEPLAVNSRHHQCVDQVGAGLVVAAVAADGVIEALEGQDGRFLVCVQWHPEELQSEPRQMLLFSGLVRAALERTARGGAR